MATEADNKPQLKVAPAPQGSADPVSRALTDLFRAVKGFAFYPPGHPMRAETVQQAFKTLSPLCAERDLILTVRSEGFSRGGKALEASPMLVQLAKECLLRRIASFTFLTSLRSHDMGSLIQLLNEDPAKVQAAGGIAGRMEQVGITTVRVNEEEVVTFRDQCDFGDPEIWETPGEEPPEVVELLRLMDAEQDDGHYQELGRLLVLRVRQERTSAVTLTALERLLAHQGDEGRTVLQREYALFILQHLADGAAEILMDHLQDPDVPDKGTIHRILKALGGKGAYWIIQRVCLAQEIEQRKSLAAALVFLGPRALPPLVAMLKDDRPWVVRNMVSIIGELRSPEAVPALKQVLYHEDDRVRKEAVRSLMKSGGPEAEATLVKLLEEKEEGVLGQAITCLGFMRSRLAVPPLLKLLEKMDLRMRDLPLRKEAIAALGRIGDRRATPVLMKLLSGWLPLVRREELKLAVAAALGALGDEAALPLLRRKSGGSGRLAIACSEAVDGIERLFGGHHD